MTVREQGSSNKLFYYTRTGPNTTFNMHKEIVLKEPVLPKRWALCVEEILRLFPEFAVRPIIRDNRICYEENHNAAPVFSQKRVRAFGTEDTNGYLFYHLVEGCRILVSFFHGLCDGVGMELFMDCVLYLYGKKSGLLKAEDTIPAIYEERLGKDGPISLAQLSEEAVDPYGFLVKKSGPPSAREPLTGDAFFIQRQKNLVQSSRVHLYSVHTETGAFLSLSKEMGVSFSALLIPLVAQAIARGGRAEEETVRIMLPVNLRQIYDVRTLVNFSDGICFSLDADQRKKPIPAQAEQCLKRLKARLSRDFFEPVLSDNVRMMRAFEEGETPADQVDVKPFVSPAEGIRPPFTCVLTCPRIIKEYSFLSDVRYCCAVSASFTVVAYTWHNHMTIRCIQKSDSDAIAGALAGCLEEAGLPAEVRDEGFLEGDPLLMGRLLKR